MPAAGDKMVDASVIVISDDDIRIDMHCYTPNQEPAEQRRTTIISRAEAQMLAIMLIRAIDQSEVMLSKRKKK